MQSYHQSGEIITERYQIVNILGEGNSGITYRVEDLQTKQQVALKVFSFQKMTEWKMMQLFEREGKILQQLNHHAIPSYLDYFQVDTEEERAFYLAQELAEGESLATKVEKGWRGDEAEIQRIAIELLEILIYLHSQKPTVIHRDLKPHNIILRDDGKIFLVDFGAVKHTYHTTMMRGSTVVGTFGYMAPEQFRGQALPTTDLYSLGATILFLLTHRSPAELPVERLKLDFRSRINVSEEFTDWLEKILEPNLKERFSSAREALDILQPKPKLIAKSRSKKGIALILGLTISLVGIFQFLERNKYAVINHIGLTEYIFIGIEKKIISIDEYLAKGGDINVKNGFGKTLLHEQVRQGKLVNVRKIIRKGGRTLIKDKGGNYPLHFASDRKVARLIIDDSANINVVNNLGKTALHIALEKRDTELAIYLLDSGIDPNILDKRGKSPLYIAYVNAYKKRKRPANVSYSERDKERKKNKSLFNLLASKGALFSDTELNNSKLKSAIDYYSGKKICEPESIAFFLGTNKDINRKNSQNNMTRLQEVTNGSCYGNYQINSVKLLINAGANLNVTDGLGRTPLHNVVRNNYYSASVVATLLINAGANLNITDNGGRKPIHLTMNKKIQKLLIDAGTHK